MPNYDSIPLPVRRRYDPERLDTVVRSVSHRTRCPECDALNPAGQKYCDRCGSALYPEWDTDSDDKKEGLSLFALLFDPEERASSQRQEEMVDERFPDYPPIKMPDSIVTACPRCYAQNPEGNNYCGKCGAKLWPEIPQQRKNGKARTRDADKPAYYK